MWKIASEVKGLSVKNYATSTLALAAARKYEKANPEALGDWWIASMDPMSAQNLGYCQCENRACECDVAEMQAVYLDAISV